MSSTAWFHLSWEAATAVGTKPRLDIGFVIFGHGRNSPVPRISPHGDLQEVGICSKFSTQLPVRLLHLPGLMSRQFLDRYDAGKRLAFALHRLSFEHPVVLALPRGGVPIGYEIARVLGAPVDVFIVRKVGVPGCREVAMGALASGGIQILDAHLIRRLGIPAEAVDVVVAEEMRELARREARYGAGHAPPLLRGRTVILVDDGLATGFTMRAAVQAARKQQPARIVVAAPVASREAVAMLEREADEVVCLDVPEPFRPVGSWYARFDQTTDDEVRDLLDRAHSGERLAG